MNQGELIPKPAPVRAPRRMLQPRKDAIRLDRELARAELAWARTPRWWRLWHRAFARVVESDPETAAAMPAHEELHDGT